MNDQAVLNSKTFWPTKYVVIKDGVVLLETNSLEEAKQDPEASAYEQAGYRQWKKI